MRWTSECSNKGAKSGSLSALPGPSPGFHGPASGHRNTLMRLAGRDPPYNHNPTAQPRLRLKTPFWGMEVERVRGSREGRPNSKRDRRDSRLLDEG